MEDEGKLGLNSQQLEQLREIEEMVYVKDLQSKCSQIQTDFEHLQKEREEHLRASEELKKRWDIIEEELKKASLEEMTIQQKLNSMKEMTSEDIRLEYICLILGFIFWKGYLLVPNQSEKESVSDINVSQFLHKHDSTVTYNDLKNLVDRIQSNPPNSEIEKIQQFVRNSQDMAGLLKSLRELIEANIMPELSNKN